MRVELQDIDSKMDVKTGWSTVSVDGTCVGRAAAGVVWLLAALVGLVILIVLLPELLAARLFRRA